MTEEIKAQIEALEKKLARHVYYMNVSEMSDDFYYTKGSYRADKEKKHQLEIEIAALKKQIGE